MYNPNNFNYYPFASHNNRIAPGSFIAPFVLGGITGGLLAPAFQPRPYIVPLPPPVPPYGPYGPYPVYYR